MTSDRKPDSDFVDPLENYDPKTYNDVLEEAFAEEPVDKIRHHPHTSIPADMTIGDAVKKLATQHVACLLVEEDDELVGVFTHREVLNKVALEPDQIDKPVRDVMTPNPVYVYADDPSAAALCVMAVSGYRHVPVLTADEKIGGIISPQRVTGFLAKHFEQ